jgi:hypothetical protein
MTKVIKAYQQALAQRNLYPLQSGEYKLKEVRDFAERYYVETQKIAKSKQTGYPCQLLHCTTPEVRTWLKSAPAFVADELGYKVVGAVAALTGDGLTPQELYNISKLAQQSVDSLLERCEYVDDLLRNSIQVEYEHMKHDDSLVADLYYRLHSLTDFLLDEVHAYQQQAA